MTDGKLRYKTKIGVCLIAVILCWNEAVSGDRFLVSLSTTKTRVIGMGGAFVSMEDDLPALAFNPASFSVRSFDNNVRLSFFANGFMPLIAGANINSRLSIEDGLGLAVKGITLSAKRVQIGILFGEESLHNTARLNRDKVFDATDFTSHNNTSFGLSVALAPEVQIGIAGELFNRNVDGRIIRKMGYRYGLRLKTKKKITVGLFFVDFPDQFKNDRLPLERLVDETLNVGFTFNPSRFVKFSVDVRNVSEETKPAVREPHAGFELFVVNHLVLRGGFFYVREHGIENYSAGLSIFNWNTMFSNGRSFTHPQFLLDLAVVVQRQDSIVDYWYLATCTLRI